MLRSFGLDIIRGAIAMVVLACISGPAMAERRIGLVIGIDRYPALPQGAQLVKAVADARAIRDLLKGPLRFDEVVYGENTSLAQARDLLISFSKTLQPGDLAFVYFAGHGMNVRLGNYLLPSDLPALRDVTTETQVRLEEESMVERSISEERLRELISLAGAKTAIVVLDACRNNIFREALAAGGPRTRALAASTQVQGARPVERPAVQGRTQFITLYSASPGQRALDSLGPTDQHPNSPFTRVLVSKLPQPGMRVYEVLRGLRSEVVRLAASAGHDQVPAIADEALEDVVLVGATSSQQAASAQVPAQAAAAVPALAPPAATQPAPVPVAPVQPSRVQTPAAAPQAAAATLQPVPQAFPVARSAGPADWAGWRLTSKDGPRGSRLGVSYWALAPNFNTIAASYRDSTLRVWSVDTGQQVGLVSGMEPQAGLAFHPSSALLAGFGGRDATTVTVWDVKSLSVLFRLAAGPEQISAIGFSADGATLVIRERRGAVRAFVVGTRQERVAMPDDASVFQDRRRSVQLPVVVSVAFDALRVSRGERNDAMLLRALPNGDWVSIAEDGLAFTGSKAAVAQMELLKGRDRLPVTDEFIASQYRAAGLRR